MNDPTKYFTPYALQIMLSAFEEVKDLPGHVERQEERSQQLGEVFDGIDGAEGILLGVHMMLVLFGTVTEIKKGGSHDADQDTAGDEAGA